MHSANGRPRSAGRDFFQSMASRSKQAARSSKPTPVGSSRAQFLWPRSRFRRGELEDQLVGFELIARHEWCRSLASAGFLLVNPILNRFSLPGVDLSWLDRIIRADSYSNLVLLSRRQR